jgi:membrane associated rhomboid family serine protease
MTYYRYRFSSGYGLTPVIKNLMIIMGAVFLLQKIAEMGQIYILIIYYFALVPILVWKEFFLWQLVTYIFLHGGVFHILFNLLALWMFGGDLEGSWGSKKFLRYFLFCGIGAGICTVLFTPYPYQRIPVIGASGAIYGILLAFGWLFPNRLIYIYFLFPIPAKYFVIIFGLIEFFSSIGGPGGGVSHLTHLGGLLFGLFYMAYPTIRQKIRREYYKRKWS